MPPLGVPCKPLLGQAGRRSSLTVVLYEPDHRATETSAEPLCLWKLSEADDCVPTDATSLILQCIQRLRHPDKLQRGLVLSRDQGDLFKRALRRPNTEDENIACRRAGRIGGAQPCGLNDGRARGDHE